jgi:hypothetical protein
MIHYTGNEKWQQNKSNTKKSKVVNNYKTLGNNILKFNYSIQPLQILDCNLSFFDYSYSNRNPKYLEL